MNRVYLDTVGLIGVWDVDDQWHADATSAFTRLTAGRVHITTTTFVLLECGNAAARTPFRLAVDRLGQRLADDGQLIKPTEDDWRRAWEGYRSDQTTGGGHCRSRS